MGVGEHEQEANNLRVKVAKISHNAQLAEKIQFDLVQQVRDSHTAILALRPPNLKRVLTGVSDASRAVQR